MSDVTELATGIAAATAAALLFGFLEWRRVSHLGAALVEASRLYGFILFSVLTVWLAVRIADPALRIALAIGSPIIAAMAVNNIYAAVNRRAGSNS